MIYPPDPGRLVPGTPDGGAAQVRAEARVSDNGLTSYHELATLLEDLPMLLREARRSRRLSTRSAADEVGVSHSTLWRVETGAGECSLANAVAVLRWLDRQGDPHA